VAGQAHHLRPSLPITKPGYVLRQLCLQAAELGESRLASDLRARLWNLPEPGLIPIWTTRRASHALEAELGRVNQVVAMAVLPDGRVVTGAPAEPLLVWDPINPSSGPVELGHVYRLQAVAALPDGRVVTSSSDGPILLWDPARPGTDPVVLGRVHRVAVAVLPDGRVVSGGEDGWILVWDSARPGTGPVKLGRHDDRVRAVAVLPDGRVVSAGADQRVLVWNMSTQLQTAQLNCSVIGLAVGQASRGEGSLVVIHEGQGFSLWSTAKRGRRRNAYLDDHPTRARSE
jgi:WD40 repeat protein